MKLNQQILYTQILTGKAIAFNTIFLAQPYQLFSHNDRAGRNFCPQCNTMFHQTHRL